MREILFKAKRRDNHEWIIGYYCKYGDNHCIIEPTEFGIAKGVGIIPETLCEFTALHDKHGKRIFEGDIVEFLGGKYEVVFECGAFGIAGVSDWEAIEKQIPISTGCDNDLHACLNDNYISLWEIHWNLENNHEVLDTVKIIGNIHDNGELITAERSE